MAKRLQVVLEDDEWQAIERSARQRRLSVAAWVRQALRAAHGAEADAETGRKLEVISRAAEHDFPTADIDQLLTEIERGYSR